MSKKFSSLRRLFSDRHAFDATAGMFGVSSYDMTGPVFKEQEAVDASDNLDELAGLIMKNEVETTVAIEPGFADSLMAPAELRHTLMLAATIVMKSLKDNGVKSEALNGHIVSCFGNLDIFQQEHEDRLVSLADIQEASDVPEVIAATHQAFETAVTKLDRIRYGE